MKNSKIIITLILGLIYNNGIGQIVDHRVGQIIIGNRDSVYSNILQEQREIWIHVPEEFDTKKRYPVVYLLDASEHFHVVSGMIKRLSSFQMPEAIIVGIINTDRIRDFTPTSVTFSRGHNTETSGGASKFNSFLEKELKPYIRKNYPTETNSTIIGHSTAGLFVVYSFLLPEHTFDHYLAIEPSLWWDNENLVNKAEDLLGFGNGDEKSLYIAVANSLGNKMDTVKVRRSKSVPTEQIRANLNFRDILKKNSKNLNYKWEYFESEDHGTVTIPAQYNGLRSLYSWFPFPELWRFNTPKKYSAKELTDPFYAHYKKLSIQMKREVKPEWQLVNDIGMFMLEGHKLPKKALAYLEMNVVFYPNESKSYTAIGNYYFLQNRKLKAIEYYEKALSMDNNQEARVKLEKLKK